MALAFRNVDADPSDPVESWPIEAIQAALERGGMQHWRRLTSAIRREPWGPLARDVEHVLGYSRPYGVAGLMERAIADARASAEKSERHEVADRCRAALARSRLSIAEFAERNGTSRSRMSTYLSGTVTPSAALLVRFERTGRP